LDIATLWQTYLRATGWRSMVWWVVLRVLLTCAVIGLPILIVSGAPHLQGRGAGVWFFHHLTWVPAALLLWGIVYWVGYETHVCAAFVKLVSNEGEVLLPRTCSCKDAKKDGVTGKLCRPYFAFRLVARATGRIQELIYAPFVLILFIVFSQSGLFDATDFPVLLLLFVGLASAYALFCVLMLRRSAESARRRILKRLNLMRFEPQPIDDVVAEPAPDGSASVNLPAQQRHLDDLIEVVRTSKAGAFASIWRQPALQAILLPFGGYGSVEIARHMLSAVDL
jgi:hypothetical protein